MIDLTDRKFGLWLVLHRAPDYQFANGRRRTAWQCRCDGCGTVHRVIGWSLGRTSFGCVSCRSPADVEKSLAAYVMHCRGLKYRDIGQRLSVSEKNAFRHVLRGYRLSQSGVGRGVPATMG